MKIGLVYDLKSDYIDLKGIENYWDFATLSDITVVHQVFSGLGHEVVLIGNYVKLNELLKANSLDVELIYNTCEGVKSRNREAFVPALLEINNIDFIGSDSYALSVCLNKFHTKLIAEYLNILTPNYLYIDTSTAKKILSGEQPIDVSSLSFPLIIKPNCEGNSTGIFKATNYSELMTSIFKVFTIYNQEFLIEEYIDGSEVTVPIVGTGDSTKIFGLVEIVNTNSECLNIYTTEDKLFSDIGYVNYSHSKKVDRYIEESALKLHNHIGCKDINRADFRVTQEGKAYFLELNPLPAIGLEGSFATIASKNNMSLSDLFKLVIESAANSK